LSRQTLRSYKDIESSLKGASSRFVADYSSLKDELTAAQRSIAGLLDSIESLKPLFDAQAPEGNITSNDSMVYFDTTNSPTSVDMYFNDTVGVDTGWVIVN
jgi:hypothetical protein